MAKIFTYRGNSKDALYSLGGKAGGDHYHGVIDVRASSPA